MEEHLIGLGVFDSRPGRLGVLYWIVTGTTPKESCLFHSRDLCPPASRRNGKEAPPASANDDEITEWGDHGRDPELVSGWWIVPGLIWSIIAITIAVSLGTR